MNDSTTYTTGHCSAARQPGGCPHHNLQCGWPNCDRKPIEPQPPSGASVSERARVSLDLNNLPAQWPWDEGSPCLDPRPVGMVYPAVPTPRAFGYLDKSGVEWAAYDTGQMEEYGRRAFADGANTALRALEQALTQQRALSSPRQEGEVRKWTPLDIQTFARAYKAEVPHATLTVHGIDAGLHALNVSSTAASTQGLREAAHAFLEAADARDNEETATQYPDHGLRLRQYKAAREDLESLLTSPTTGADGVSHG